jgi:hypothetical protein
MNFWIFKIHAKKNEKISPEEEKKEAIFRVGTRQLKKILNMGFQFPIVAVR